MADELGRLFLEAAKAELRRRHQRFRALLAMVDEEELNWRPVDVCNSLANLAAHFTGNLGERYLKTIDGQPFERNRDAEFDPSLRLTPAEALEMIDRQFAAALDVLERLPPERLTERAPLPTGEAPLVDFILQTLVHYGEHVGQAIYLVKLQQKKPLQLPT